MAILCLNFMRASDLYLRSKPIALVTGTGVHTLRESGDSKGKTERRTTGTNR